MVNSCLNKKNFRVTRTASFGWANTCHSLLDGVLFVTGYHRSLDEHFPGRELSALGKPLHYHQFAESLTEIMA